MKRVNPSASLFAPGARSRLQPGAFTLLELLVVLALLGAFLGMAAPAFFRGDESVALASAQRTLASLATSARSRAILTQRPVRLLVFDEETDPEGRLRKLQIVVQDAVEPTRWTTGEVETTLPGNIALVPQSPPVAEAVSWSGAPISSFTNRVTLSVNGAPARSAWYLEFTSRGTVVIGPSGGSKQLVVAPVRRTAIGVVFIEPTAVRGLRFRSSGVFTLLDSFDAF